MITLDNLFTFFEFIAEENTYIQHQPGTTGSTNRFSRFATESTTGQLSKLGYPRLEVVQLPFGLITDFSSSQQETLTARVRVIYKLSDKFDFDEEVTALDNAKKALFQMLNYIQTAQDECPGNSLLCAFDMNSVRYTLLDKATFSGSAVGCELSINFKKGICWEEVAYGDFPEYNGTIALPTTAGSYVLRLLNGVYSWVTASAGASLYQTLANLSTSVATDYNSNTKYPSVNAVYDWAMSTFASVHNLTVIDIVDDFIGYTGGIGNAGGAGTAITSLHTVVKGITGLYSKTTDANHIGILTYTSSSNTTSTNNYIYMNSWNLGNGEFTMEFMFRIPALATGTKDFVMPMGLVDAVTYAAITNGVYFLYNRRGYGATIQCVCMSGGLTNLQSSEVNITAATWHKYKIVVNADGTEAKFYINETLVQTMATYIPVNVLLYSFFGQQITTSSFNVCGFDIDYIYYSLTLTTPR